MIKMITKPDRLYRIPASEATANRLYAGVDLGSNTFRLIIARLHDGRIEPVVKQLHAVRLGEALHRTGRLSEQAIRRALATLAGYRALLDRHRPTAVRICGTAALRAAANREEFLREAAVILGQAAEVIDGEEEARLSGIGAYAAMRARTPEPLLLADVGGGSSELLVATDSPNGPVITASVSLPLGAVHLSESFLHAEPPAARELAAMAAHIDEVMIPALAAMAPLPKTVVGIGGTATALAALDCNLSVYDGDRIQDHRLAGDTLDAILARLCHLTGTERNRLPGLGDGRGEIILGGLMIFLSLLKALPAPRLTVSDGGLLEGILLSAAGSNGPA